jgi:hypothetical protein
MVKARPQRMLPLLSMFAAFALPVAPDPRLPPVRPAALEDR